jgi:hypothetical protein
MVNNNELAPVLVTGVVFWAVVTVFRIMSDNRLRHRLVDKGIVDENIKYLYSAKQDSRFAALKWGMMLIGIGIAFLVGQLTNNDELGVTAAFFCAGIALILYHVIAKKIEKNGN